MLCAVVAVEGEDPADRPRKHFDPDTRELVQVKVVHGSWKREDMNGIGIEVGLGHSLLLVDDVELTYDRRQPNDIITSRISKPTCQKCTAPIIQK